MNNEAQTLDEDTVLGSTTNDSSSPGDDPDTNPTRDRRNPSNIVPAPTPSLPGVSLQHAARLPRRR